MVKCFKTFSISRQGTITLEAVILMPFVIIVFLIFYMNVQLAVIEHAMRTTATATVQQIAQYYYPVYRSTQKFGNIGTSNFDLPGLQELLKMGEQATLKTVIRPFVLRQAAKDFINPNQLHIDKFTILGPFNPEEPFVELQIRYDFFVKMPFYQYRYRLQKSALERVWTGDGPLEFGNSMSTEVRILSIEPAKVRRGSVAVIEAKVPPDSTANIRIDYKSGSSVATGLSSKKSNNQGIIFWQWKVGGNTTPGTWKATVSAGEASDTKFFEVYRK